VNSLELTELASVVALGTRLFVAPMLVLAALHKVRNLLEFQGIVAQYKLMPAVLAPGATLLIVALEVTAAILLLALPYQGLLLASALLGLYAVAISINLARGRRGIDCGCGGEPVPISGALVLRNLVLVALLLSAAIGATERPGIAEPSGLWLSLGFAAGLGVLYASGNQLLANSGIYQRLWLKTGSGFGEEMQ
jgi:hypothetical protein